MHQSDQNTDRQSATSLTSIAWTNEWPIYPRE